MHEMPTDKVRALYREELGSLLDGKDVRECENDVLSLLELETDWSGMSAIVERMRLDDRGAHEYMRSVAEANWDRARNAVSAISNSQYALIKCRFEAACDDSERKQPVA